jgi:hypothetical protein
LAGYPGFGECNQLGNRDTVESPPVQAGKDLCGELTICERGIKVFAPIVTPQHFILIVMMSVGP